MTAPLNQSRTSVGTAGESPAKRQKPAEARGGPPAAAPGPQPGGALPDASAAPDQAAQANTDNLEAGAPSVQQLFTWVGTRPAAGICAWHACCGWAVTLRQSCHPPAPRVSAVSCLARCQHARRCSSACMPRRRKVLVEHSRATESGCTQDADVPHQCSGSCAFQHGPWHAGGVLQLRQVAPGARLCRAGRGRRRLGLRDAGRRHQLCGRPGQVRPNRRAHRWCARAQAMLPGPEWGLSRTCWPARLTPSPWAQTVRCTALAAELSSERGAVAACGGQSSALSS